MIWENQVTWGEMDQEMLSISQGQMGAILGGWNNITIWYLATLCLTSYVEGKNFVSDLLMILVHHLAYENVVSNTIAWL